MVDPELLTILNSMNQKIDSLYEMKNKVDSLYEMKDKVDSLYEMKDKVNSIDKRLSSLENIVTVMQYEHGRKLDLLLDYAKANMEKHEEYDKQFAYMHSKFFDYDVRLSVIEDSEYYKRVMAEKNESANKGRFLIENQKLDNLS